MTAVYIAARFSRRHEANALANELQRRGHTITSRWVRPEVDHVLPTGLSAQAEDAERQRFALEDLDDVRAADCVVSLMEEPRSNGRGGRHVEFGIGLGLGHDLVIIGPRETVFHHLPQVTHFETTDAFLAAIDAAALEKKRTAMKLVIVESPYAGDIEDNVAYARAALRDCLNRGEAPIASHLLHTQPGVLRDEVPAERRLGIDAGLAWRAVAEEAVFYVDRGWSSGMTAARDLYLREGFPFTERSLHVEAKQDLAA